jgi:tetrahydromethanopterin:alpha-L-glutamate ligase
MPAIHDAARAEPADAGPLIALFIDRHDWHAKQLTAALTAKGARVIALRLASCGFNTRRPAGLNLPGFGPRLPDLAIVRAIGAGTFESVTMRLGILHALEAMGVPVANRARAIEACVDKSMTSFLLAKHAIATPATWTVQTWQAAAAIVRTEAPRGPLVLKPLFGAQGRGLKLMRHRDDLPTIEEQAGVYYLQRFVGPERDDYSDFRVIVSQGAVVAAMARHARHWITNVKLGARPSAVDLDAGLVATALKAAAAVGTDFAGVDLIRCEDGSLTVIEVNSMPGWRGLQSVVDFSIAERLADDLLARYAVARYAWAGGTQELAS